MKSVFSVVKTAVCYEHEIKKKERLATMGGSFARERFRLLFPIIICTQRVREQKNMGWFGIKTQSYQPRRHCQDVKRWRVSVREKGSRVNSIGYSSDVTGSGSMGKDAWNYVIKVRLLTHKTPLRCTSCCVLHTVSADDCRCID